MFTMKWVPSLVFMLVLSQEFVRVSSSSVSSKLYWRDTFSNNGNVYRQINVISVSSRLLCASKCGKDPKCVHFFYDNSRKDCVPVTTDSAYSKISDSILTWEFFASGQVEIILCDFTYIESIDKCVQIVTFKASWTTARSRCMEDGGDLIALDTSASLQYFRSYFSDRNVGRAHVGAHRVSGTFRWTLTNGLVSSGSWGRYQPDNSYGDEDCADLLDYSDMYLNDIRCHDQGQYVCEYPMN